ncbi:MAG TPA: adenine deaminase [Dissulfurispiraceae bacterium]|nr:adenine deaminase [Dissulfurispiraceae bacterium]
MADQMYSVSGNIIDAVNGVIYPGTMLVRNGRIEDITEERDRYDSYIVPGLVDSHVHVESSMLVPSEFGRIAAVHGAVAAVADPHDIANVLGVAGVDFMLENSKRQPFKFYFGAPSCVPSTRFETSGATIGPEEVADLLQKDEIRFLGEVMNYPAVLGENSDIMEKIGLARQSGKCIDGHAPGLRGESLSKYIAAGITTDHEITDREDGREKLKMGMKIQIREGSAARNLDDLILLVRDNPEGCMFCSDNIHPGDIVRGHINDHVRKALDVGIDPLKVFRCSSVNPVRHYGLDVGLLQRGDPADFLVVNDLKNFTVGKTFINGRLVAENGGSLFDSLPAGTPNNFNVTTKNVADFSVRASGWIANVIQVLDDSPDTGMLRASPYINGGFARSDPQRDVLKIVVINRYYEALPAIAFVKNFGLRKGAIASSVSHDSHNIICIGVSDEDITRAVNMVIENGGGMAAYCSEFMECLPLPAAGLMSDLDGFEVAKKYRQLDGLAKALGTNLRAPFMTLSFMSLLAVPRIKLSNLGLIDTTKFAFLPLFGK